MLGNLKLKKFIKVARRERPADLVLKNANLVNVLSGEIYEVDVPVFNQNIAGLGGYRGPLAFSFGCFPCG